MFPQVAFFATENVPREHDHLGHKDHGQVLTFRERDAANKRFV